MSGSAEPQFGLETISKSYGAHRILSDFSCSFTAGERVLVLGGNGAGKSTFLKVCVGLITPDGGKRALKVSAPRFGYIGHHSLLYGALTVRENLELFAGLTRDKNPIALHLERWKLGSYADRRVDELSKGLEARVSLCRALMGNPEFLFLDEPTAALDEGSVGILLDELSRAIAARPSIIAVVATHDLHRMSAFGQRVIVLADGKIVEDTGPQSDGWESRKEKAVAKYRDLNR